MIINTEFMKETFWLALQGVPATLKLTAFSLVFALIFGSLLALIKIHRVKVASQLITGYVSIIRGTPMVLQILIVYSLVPSLLNSIVKDLGWEVNVFDLDPIVYAYIVFIINTTALLTETIRSALMSIEKTQMEAALTAGLTPFWAYVRIIIPQALEAALPNLCTTAINLVKGTSLAYMMSVKEVTAIAKTQASYGYNYIEAYLDIFAIYLIICIVVQALFQLVERRVGRHRRTVRAA